MIWPILEARADILQKIWSLFGQWSFKKNCFWDFLTFTSLKVIIKKSWVSRLAFLTWKNEPQQETPYKTLQRETHNCTGDPQQDLQRFPQLDLHVRYRPRFFDHHQTTYVSIGNRHFFTISCHHQTYQNYEQSRQKMGKFLVNKVL